MPKKLNAESIEASDSFSYFLENDPTITRLLSVGLSFGEILKLYKEKNDISDYKKYYDAFYRQTNIHNKENGISGKNITKIAEDIGGRRFAQVCNIVIYYNKNSSSVTRILFEMEDSGIDSYSLTMLDAFSEGKPVTKKDIEMKMTIKYNHNRYSDTNLWLTRLYKKGYIKEENGSYMLGQPLVPYFSKKNREIWEELKTWSHRRRIFL